VQVKISVRHGQLSDDHQKDIRDKAEQLLHYFDRLNFIEVTVDMHQHKTDGARKVEIVATAEHKQEFVAAGENEDLMIAFGAASDKVKQQIKHYKEKLQDHRRDPSHNDINGK
jgi:putative sigma-54 modulation protein